MQYVTPEQYHLNPQRRQKLGYVEPFSSSFEQS